MSAAPVRCCPPGGVPGGEAKPPLEAEPQGASTGGRASGGRGGALEASVSRPFDWTCPVAFAFEETDP